MTVAGAVAAAAAMFLACLAVFGVAVPAPRLRRESVHDVALACAGACVGVVAAGVVLGMPALGLAGSAVPLWWKAHQRASERARAEASIVPTLETIVASSRAGIVLPEALAIARMSAAGELGSRIGDALHRIRLGAAPADALGAAADGASHQLRAFIRDLTLCARARLDTTQTAAYLDDILGARRFERELRSDIRARTAGARFQIWLLAALVPGLALYLGAMSPTLADQLTSPLGRYLLIPLGVAFEVVGVVASQRVVARACD